MNSSPLEITSLWIYPLKSCGGVQLEKMDITPEGPLLDRRWMIVDEIGKFITQRDCPQLATVQVRLKKNLEVQIGQDTFQLDINKTESLKSLKTVEVWKSELVAEVEDQKICECFSDFLGKKSFLVRYKTESPRALPNVRFADSRPMLVINQSSLDELNLRLAQLHSPAVTSHRFRPNIVVQGTTAYEEDQWMQLKTDSVELIYEKLCSRCVMVTVDQTTGISQGPEPLKTLASYRRQEGKVNFGTFYKAKQAGTLSVGQSFRIN